MNLVERLCLGDELDGHTVKIPKQSTQLHNMKGNEVIIYKLIRVVIGLTKFHVLVVEGMSTKELSKKFVLTKGKH